MAIIKCDDVVEEQQQIDDVTGSATTVKPYVEQDEVSLGKKLLAVESDFSTENASKTPLARDAQAPFLTENRPSDIIDQFRAEFGKFWVQDTSDKESGMVFLNRGLGNQQAQEDWEGVYAPTAFELEEIGAAIMSSPPDGSPIGLLQYTQNYKATALESHWDFANNYTEASDIWTAYTQGIDAERGSFSRPTPLVPDGETFTDHAFQMNTPFSKKELEMFANISNTPFVADVESDYDFFAKAYEEGIASTNVPENALPHLYTEVQRGESGTKNTDELPEGYFREWMNTVLSNSDKMSKITEDYENVAILDSVVDKENILDSKNKTTSAFEILMAYANRENLFPMNINIEVDTNNASDLMFEAEDVGMVDDIVRMLMGDGNIVAPTEVPTPKIEPKDGDDDDYVEIPEEKEYGWNKVGNQISYDFGINYNQEKKYYEGKGDSGNLWSLINNKFESNKNLWKNNSGDFSSFKHYAFIFIDDFVEEHDTGSGVHSKILKLNSNDFTRSYDGGATYVQHGSGDTGDDTKIDIIVDEDGGIAYVTVYNWGEKG